MHALISSLLQHPLYLLISLRYIILVLSLNVQIQLSTSYLRLLPGLHIDSSERNRAVGLLLYTVEKSLVTGLLSCSQRIVIDFKVIREKVCTLMCS
jgi:hypothetical protein